MRLTVVLSLAIISLLQTGCHRLLGTIKAEAAPQTQFTAPYGEMTAWPDRLPWLRSWYRDKAAFYQNRARYRTLYIPPVRTDFTVDTFWWDEANMFQADEHGSDTRRLADFMREQFQKAVQDDPQGRYRLTDSPDADTLVLELALVELLPTKVHWNVAGTALGVVVPGGSLLKAVTSARGSVAFEAKLLDGGTGELQVMLADREQDQLAIVSLADFTPYRHAERAIESWAEQFVAIVNTPMAAKVDDTLPVTLLPW